MYVCLTNEPSTTILCTLGQPSLQEHLSSSQQISGQGLFLQISWNNIQETFVIWFQAKLNTRKLTNNDLPALIIKFYVVHCNWQIDDAAFGEPARNLGVVLFNLDLPIFPSYYCDMFASSGIHINSNTAAATASNTNTLSLAITVMRLSAGSFTNTVFPSADRVMPLAPMKLKELK